MRGKVFGRGPHRGDESSMGWWEAAGTAVFCSGDDGVAAGGDV
jgi:hypothetical protein